MKIFNSLRIFRNRPKSRLVLKTFSAIFGSIIIYSVVWVSLIVDLLMQREDYFSERTVLLLTLLMLEFINSISISMFIGKYFIDVNRISRESGGENIIPETKILRLILYFQICFLLPGAAIIVLGSMILLILGLLLTILIFKIIVLLPLTLVLSIILVS